MWPQTSATSLFSNGQNLDKEKINLQEKQTPDASQPSAEGTPKWLPQLTEETNCLGLVLFLKIFNHLQVFSKPLTTSP